MNNRRSQRRMSRRTLLGQAALGAAGMTLLGRHGLSAWAAPDSKTVPGSTGKARSVIEVWLWGGPSHTDTFDPKPNAGRDYTGPLNQTIPTNVPGIQIGQSLPLLAQQADKYSLIRSMTHGINGHETAAYIMQTGRRSGEGDRLVYPSLGALVSKFRGYGAGYSGMIPPYVVMTRPLSRFALEGFLGLEYKPFATGGDPRRDPFAVEGIVLQGVSEERQHARRELLKTIDTLGKALEGNPEFEQADRCKEKAYDLILGDAGKVFDLRQEKDEVRNRYGRNTLGQSCLAARRLVEQGVPYIVINHGGWDTHKRHFESMRQKLPELDSALSALLEDLHQRGLLDSTVVWCSGEFGRGPRVQWQPPWNGGRSHFGRCFSALLAGGGFQGGTVIGASDETSSYVAERPVEPHDLLSSILTQVGVDPDSKIPNDRELDVTVQPPSEQGRGVGRLTEIMT